MSCKHFININLKKLHNNKYKQINTKKIYFKHYSYKTLKHQNKYTL